MEDNLNPAPVDPGVAINNETAAEAIARKFKVTVDGEDLEVDEAELLKGYTHNKAAAKRMQEAAAKRQEAEQVLRMFLENPEDAMRQMGRDPYEFAEKVINAKLNDAMLTPEQRELREYKRKVEAYEAEQRAIRERMEAEEAEAKMQQMSQELETGIISSLEASGLPKTSFTLTRMIYYMQSAIQAGYHNVTPNDVVPFVKKDYVADIKAMMGGLNEDLIEEFLGSDVTRRIAKATVKKSGGLPSAAPREVNRSIREAAKETKPKIKSPREVFRRY